MGIPVVATNVGALGKRVEQMNCGWLVSRDASAKEIYSLLKKIDGNRFEIEKYKRVIQQIEKKDLNMMGQDYEQLYSKLGNEKKELSLMYMLKHAHEEINLVQDLNDNIDYEERVRLVAAEKELWELKQSLIIRIALRIRKIDFLGKERLKRLLCRFLNKER